MPVLNRTLFGALVGALLVLVFHWYTRPYFSPWVVSSGTQMLSHTPLLAENVERAPSPDTAERAAYWMLLASDRMLADRVIESDNVDNWIEVAQEWSRRDGQNAFWHQMLAVMLSMKGDNEGSRSAWERAARQPRWNDYQTERLFGIVRALHPAVAQGPAWESVWVYHRRSASVAQVIFRFASRQLTSIQPRSESGLSTRAVVLKNGVLLRDGSKGAEAFRIGMAMVELSSRNRGVSREISQRKLLLQRFEFVNDLRALGRDVDADLAANEFRKNSSWEAVVDPDEQSAVVHRITALSLATVTLPSGFIFGAAVFFSIFLLGLLARRVPALAKIFNSRIAPWSGFAAGILVYAFSGWMWAALLLVVGMSLFGFVPTSQRQTEPTDLGPLFRLLVAMFGFCALVVWIVYWAVCTTGGSQLLGDIIASQDLTRNAPALLGIIGILVFLALLLAPVWAMVQRYPAPRLVPIVLSEFGGRMTMVCLVLAVLLGPLAVWLDQDNRKTASALAENEPIYFYNQWNQ